MTDMWPYIGIKTGGIKRGELVVIGAFSKKDVGIRTIVNDKAVCMYQIQVRKWNQTDWVNWHRPWLTKPMAEVALEAVVKCDEEAGIAGVYVYQIVEV